MRFALAAFVSLIGVGPGWTAAKPSDLLRQEALANEACRDGTGEHATAAACDLRDIIDRKLKAVGWCYGRPGEDGAHMDWHPCGR